MELGPSVDLSVVIPTKNESITIKEFLSWIREGAQRAGLTYEILIMDSSSDATPEIAKKMGAQVVEVVEKGLGAAYRAAKPYVKGKYVLLGDADCTYDFRKLGDFYEHLERGHTFVIGNRFKGGIEKGSMPIHHRYFGTPATSLFFKYLLGINSSDIHCGMRAMTRDLFINLPFFEPGWEYATEMIVSASNLGAEIIEIPIEFKKEPPGRISHHKRAGWREPFRAGWGTLRVTWMYSFDRLFKTPGVVLGFTCMLLSTIFIVLPTSYFLEFEIGYTSVLLTCISSILGFALHGLGSASSLLYRMRAADKPDRSSKVTNVIFSYWAAMSILVLFGVFYLFIQWNGGTFEIQDSYFDNLRKVAIFCLLLEVWFISTIRFLIRSLMVVRK